MKTRPATKPASEDWWWRLVTHPAFEQTWKEDGRARPPDDKAIRALHQRLRASPQDMTTLVGALNDLVEAAGDWACTMDWAAIDAAAANKAEASDAFNDDALQRFQEKVANVTTTLAVCYLLQGVFLGFVTRCRIGEQ